MKPNQFVPMSVGYASSALPGAKRRRKLEPSDMDEAERILKEATEDLRRAWYLLGKAKAAMDEP